MAFAPIKPGGWAFGEILTSAQLNALDADHANAVDGLNGGTYALVAPLALNDAAVTIESLTTGTLTAPLIDGTTAIDGNLSVSESMSVSEDLRCYSEVETQQLKVNFTALFDATSTFDGETTFNQDVAVDAPLETSGPVTLGGSGVISVGAGGAATVELTSPTFVYKPIRPQAGGFTLSRVVIGANVNASYGPQNHDEVFIPPGTLSADRVYTIDDTNALNGACLRFVSFDSSFRVRINQPDGTLIIYVKLEVAVSTTYDAELRRIGGIWTLVGTRFL